MEKYEDDSMPIAIDDTLVKIRQLITKLDKDNNGKITVSEKINALQKLDINGDGINILNDKRDFEIYGKLINLINEDKNFLKNLKSNDLSIFSTEQIAAMKEIASAVDNTIVPSPDTPIDIEKTFAQTFTDLKELYTGLDTEKIKAFLEKNPTADTIKYKNEDGVWVHLLLNDDRSISCAYVDGWPVEMRKNEDGSVTKKVGVACIQKAIDKNGDFVIYDDKHPMPQTGVPQYDEYTLYPDGSMLYKPSICSASIMGKSSELTYYYENTGITALDVDSNPDLSKLTPSTLNVEKLYSKTFEELDGLYTGLDTDKIKAFLKDNPDTKMVKYKNEEGKWIHLQLNNDKSIACAYVDGKPIKIIKNEDGSITKFIRRDKIYSIDDNGDIHLIELAVISKTPQRDIYTLYPDGTLVHENVSGLFWGPQKKTVTTYKEADISAIDVDSINLSCYKVVSKSFKNESEKTEEILTYNDDGSVATEIIKNEKGEQHITYSSDGTPKESLYKYDDNYDGIFDSIISEEYDFDEKGNLISKNSKIDDDADGKWDSLKKGTFVVDESGNTINANYQFDLDGDQNYDYAEQISYSYDKNGQMSASTYLIDNENDGKFDIKEEYKYEYDKFGNLSRTFIKADENNDGVVDRVSDLINVYDDSNKLIQSTYKLDENGDEKYDSQTITNYENGVIKNELFSSDLNADGNMDVSTITSYEYDILGNKTKMVYEYDGDNDGNIDIVHTNRYEYDINGNITKHTIEKDNNNDGIVDSVETISYAYDANGRNIFKYVSLDQGNDNIIDLESQVMNTYNFDGTLSSSISFTRAYDEKGQLSLLSQEVDVDGDSIADETIKKEYDSNGNYIETIMKDNQYSKKMFDSIGRELQMFDEKGNVLVTADYDDFKLIVCANGQTYCVELQGLKFAEKCIGSSSTDLYYSINLDEVYEYMTTKKADGTFPTQNDLQNVIMDYSQILAKATTTK